MEKEFEDLMSVTYEQARILKKIGYPQRFLSSMAWYDENGKKYDSSINVPMGGDNKDNECVAPSLELVAKWLRNHMGVMVMACEQRYTYGAYYCKYSEFGWGDRTYIKDRYNTYEEALTKGIDEVLGRMEFEMEWAKG